MSEEVVDWEYGIGFEKLVSEDDGVMYVAGEASNGMQDNDGEVMDMESLKGAFDTYMKNPVIRFMHDKSPQWKGAIGRVVEKYTEPDGKEHVTRFGETPYLVAKFTKGAMPGWMWTSIKENIYNGFSIGGKALKKVKGRIFVKSWLETSVVDVPSANGAFFTVLKATCTGPNCPYEKGGIGSGQKGHKTAEDKKRFLPEIGERVKISSNVGGGYGNVIDFSRDKKYVIIETHKEGKQSYHISDISPVTIGKLSTILDRFIHNNGETHMKIDKFVQTADTFLKGGPGSGQKGHKSAGRDSKDKMKGIFGYSAVSIMANIKESQEVESDGTETSAYLRDRGDDLKRAVKTALSSGKKEDIKRVINMNNSLDDELDQHYSPEE